MLNVILLLLSLTWVIYCVVWFITPIRRDRIIAEKEGRFLGGVICFVLAVPLLISTFIPIHFFTASLIYFSLSIPLELIQYPCPKFQNNL